MSHASFAMRLDKLMSALHDVLLYNRTSGWHAQLGEPILLWGMAHALYVQPAVPEQCVLHHILALWFGPASAATCHTWRSCFVPPVTVLLGKCGHSQLCLSSLWTVNVCIAFKRGSATTYQTSLSCLGQVSVLLYKCSVGTGKVNSDPSFTSC